MLVTSPQGHVLLDGALPQSAPLIAANIRALGFRTEDVKVILTSHAHYDHAGGIAALQRATGATVMAAPWTARALVQGVPLDDDPQIGFGKAANAFPAVKNVKVVQDGEVIKVGPLAITAHLVPGHTPGNTAYTWDACDAAAGGTPRCLHMVYADSLTAVSSDDYRFTDHPDLVRTFRASIATLEALPCDIVVSTHPDFTDIPGKLKRRGTTAPGAAGDPFSTRRGARPSRPPSPSASTRDWPAKRSNGTALALLASVQAVIFDIDGTLIDSVDAHARAWQDTFRPVRLRRRLSRTSAARSARAATS